VTVAFLVAVGAAESGRPTLIFRTKEPVRLALDGVAIKRCEAAGGRYYVCPVCFNSKKLDETSLIAGAEVQGTVPLWNWIGDEGATTFNY
jgi:predicted peroxiredoxin